MIKSFLITKPAGPVERALLSRQRGKKGMKNKLIMFYAVTFIVRPRSLGPRSHGF